MLKAGRHNTYLREETAQALSLWDPKAGRETIAGCVHEVLRAVEHLAAIARTTWSSQIPLRSWGELQTIYDETFPLKGQIPEPSEFLARLVEAMPPATESDMRSVVRPVIMHASSSDIALLEFYLRRHRRAAEVLSDVKAATTAAKSLALPKGPGKTEPKRKARK